MENEDPLSVPLSVTDTHISAPTFLQSNQQRNVNVDNLDRRNNSPLTINTGDIDIVAPTMQYATAASKLPSVRNESIGTDSSTFWFSNFFGFGRKFATRQEDNQERHSDPEIIVSPPLSPTLEPPTNETRADAKLPVQAHWTIWQSLKLAFAMSKDVSMHSTADIGTKRRKSRLWRVGSDEKNAVKQEPKSILKKRPMTVAEEKEPDLDCTGSLQLSLTNSLDSSTSYATTSPPSPHLIPHPTHRPTAPCAIPIPTSPGVESPRQRSLFFDSTPPAVIPAYSPTKYNRRPERGFTYLRLTPKLRDEIVEELNTFKREEMRVHSESAGMTAFH
ncbi:hypothetical protein BC937DRAFT_94151 [Endogone sp. FLAS-F59071]|nr:hypothetical protein BC937DRAFT_94151 [Endogone sp. FLAS-F59071]|eukprot:RUS14233.1 hypothetical protein BC937DRAFT_94151 [Endogone sp. FLAS-F59071]